MNVLVTGGAGYIGAHAVKQLVEAGHRVAVVDNLCRGHREAVHPKAEFHRLDLADTDALASVLRRSAVDCVMHFAALAYVGESVAEPLAYYRNNTAGAISLLEAMKAAGVKRVGLLATRFTMEQDFYVGRLTKTHGLEVVLPDEADRAAVHAIIFDELCCGVARDESRERLKAICRDLRGRGAEGVILGCTELGLLLRPGDCSVPIFDTTVLHAEAAAELAMGGNGLMTKPPK